MRTIEKKTVKAGNYVGTEHVDSLIRNYKKDRWMQNSEKIGKEDTLGIWYSADELEEFIQTAKLHGADGIRIAFGVYGGNAPRKENEGRQTVALIATCSLNEENEAPAFKDLYVEKDGKAGLMAYNMGFPLPNVLPGTNPPPTTVTMGGDQLGTLMVADKNKGLMII
ncbi:hypothetical protein Q4E93_24440 [Flavitalea sp. BT771]|uniref:hypothetical protein n=1 Tax=Flavitalea sp. BT771 TaxID=3063329 RepID=UPI0026E22EBA|nr:hypothetical protein [Flavitalea sp. BT771]MDO6433777.1 hypothetical protein [Flavitalea sp. BT771]MDV6222318.1 hypothetical protein [Flavitalea sp. BT771]